MIAIILLSILAIELIFHPRIDLYWSDCETKLNCILWIGQFSKRKYIRLF